MVARLEPCPLCFSPYAALLYSSRDKNMERDFFRCPKCDLVFVPDRYHIGAEAEKERYLTHNNVPADEDYRAFLDRLHRLPALTGPWIRDSSWMAYSVSSIAAR